MGEEEQASMLNIIVSILVFSVFFMMFGPNLISIVHVVLDNIHNQTYAVN